MNIDNLIAALKETNHALTSLAAHKKELMSELLTMLPYNPLGQKTIETAEYKVKVTAGIKYRVNQAIAEQYTECFPEGMNPLKLVSKYELDAKKYKQLLMYPELREVASEFVIEIPKAVSIEVL